MINRKFSISRRIEEKVICLLSRFGDLICFQTICCVVILIFHKDNIKMIINKTKEKLVANLKSINFDY